MKASELNPTDFPIRIVCEAADTLPLEKLTDFQGNLKKLSEANRKKLALSICKEGFMAPIFVWKNEDVYRILDGHGRLKTLTWMKGEGWDIPDLPVVYIEADDVVEARGKLLAITSQYGVFDNEELSIWLEELDDDIQDSIRLVDEEIDISVPELDDETTGDDEAPEVPEDPETVQGDLWELGNHRLLCGDSTSESDVLVLMDGKLADQLVTDPPYNVAYEGKTKDAMTIQNDDMDNDSFRQFLVDVYKAADSVLKQGAVFYIWHADSEGYNFRGAAFDIGWTIRQCLIWKKNSMVMGRQDYHWQHEPCLYGWKDGAGHLWATDRKQTTILEFDRPTRNDLHPTMKPVALIEYCVKNNTKGQDIVLDLFGGSGSTLIACEKTGRNNCSMELDPKYCDVIVQRYINFCKENGRELVVKKNGEEYTGGMMNE